MNNWLDVVFVLTIILFAFVGLSVGIVRALIGIAGVMLGLNISSQYYKPLAEQLSVFITHPTAADMAAFGMIMVAVMVASLFLSMVLRALGTLIFTGWADRMAGMFLGIGLGFMACYVLALGLAKFNFPGVGEKVGQSAIGPWLLKNLAFLGAFLPPGFMSS